MSNGFQMGDLFNMVFRAVPAVKVPSMPSIADIEGMMGKGSYQVAKGFKGSNAFYPKDELQKSPFGTDVYFSFVLGGESLNFFDPVSNELRKEFISEFRIPLAVLVDFDRGKDIVRTQVSGGMGSVKELFSLGDWKINIKGIIMDEKGPSPAGAGRTAVELMRQMRWLASAADSIPVKGWLFNEYEVNRIVIETLRFKQVERSPWVIGFELQCESDISPELDIMAGGQYRRV